MIRGKYECTNGWREAPPTAEITARKSKKKEEKKSGRGRMEIDTTATGWELATCLCTENKIYCGRNTLTQCAHGHTTHTHTHIHKNEIWNVYVFFLLLCILFYIICCFMIVFCCSCRNICFNIVHFGDRDEAEKMRWWRCNRIHGNSFRQEFYLLMALFRLCCCQMLPQCCCWFTGKISSIKARMKRR